MRLPKLRALDTRSLNLLGWISVTLIIVACEDAVAPGLRTPPLPRMDYVEMGIDSTKICPEFQCRDLDPWEIAEIEDVIYNQIDWTRSGDCYTMGTTMRNKLYGNQIKAALQMPGTMLGAFAKDDHLIYLRHDQIQMENVKILAGHEVAHAMGLGDYPDHETDMNDFARGCMRQ